MGVCLQNFVVKFVIKKMLNRKYCLVVIDSSVVQEESEFCYRRNVYSVKCSMKKKNYVINENEELSNGEFTCQDICDRI